MAKRIKRRINARLKPFIFERIERIANATGANYTEVMEEALERGLNWMKTKIRKELDPAFDWKEQAPVQVEYTKKTEEILDSQSEWEKDMKHTIEVAKTRWIDD